MDLLVHPLAAPQYMESTMELAQHTTLERLQVSIREAARLLSFSERTVYALLERGELRSVGQGRLRRIPVDELRRWQQRHMN
jgi:excisionase family DNA binding protein